MMVLGKDLQAALPALVLLAGASPTNAAEGNRLKPQTGITSELMRPNSTFFSTANVAYASTLNVKASDGDLWPTTWADDGSLYTANGDGRGFSSNQDDWADIVVNRIDGTPESGITGERLMTGPSLGPVWSEGEYNRKPTGMVAVDGDGDGKDELYLAIQDLNSGPAGPGGGPTGEAFNDAPAASIARSTDYGVTWTATETNMFGDYKFTTIFFLDFGQSNKHASVLGDDGANYVYAYGLDNNWRDSVNGAVEDPQKLYLARAPISSIQEVATWEFFSGTADAPAWSGELDQRQSVLNDNRRLYKNSTDPEGWSVLSQGSVVYNAPLERYIYSSWTDYSFEFYESPQPWGPFTVFHHRDFGVAPWTGINTPHPKNGGYATTTPSKFISADGTKMWVQSNWFVDPEEGSEPNYCVSLRPLTVTKYEESTPSPNCNETENLAMAPGATALVKAAHAGHLDYLNDGNTDNSEDSWDGTTKDFDRWGYAWPVEHKFNRVIYKTGAAFPDGGYFASDLKVRVRKNFEWSEVSGQSVDPEYPYSPEANPFKAFTFTFDEAVGDAIEILGVPGGEASFTSIGELEVYRDCSGS